MAKLTDETFITDLRPGAGLGAGPEPVDNNLSRDREYV